VSQGLGKFPRPPTTLAFCRPRTCSLRQPLRSGSVRSDHLPLKCQTIKAAPCQLFFTYLRIGRDSEGRQEKSAAIILSGNGGEAGVLSPACLSVTKKLASLDNGISVMRLGYRYPARNKHRVKDISSNEPLRKRFCGILLRLGWIVFWRGSWFHCRRQRQPTC